jgi:2-polyprenyl-3-methyl-5-hydroxy-6-metoxy-1,4-benzoquinol methylase
MPGRTLTMPDSEVTLDPVAAYDRIAPDFSKLAEPRRKYLDAVEKLVVAGIPTGSRSLLDVGTGDGSRARRIADAREISELLLVEPSVEMQRNGAADTRFTTMRAEDLYVLQAKFDVILCLWNVLGHIFPASGRQEALRQFARLVSPQGRVFFDVSHRYNARHYGALPTAVRFLGGLLSGHEPGDVTVSWSTGRIHCTTAGHVFTHREIAALSRSVGLKIEDRFVVDYTTGEQRRWSAEGHLLYILRA